MRWWCGGGIRVTGALRDHPPTVSHPSECRSSSSLGCAILPGGALDTRRYARTMVGALVVIAVLGSRDGALRRGDRCPWNAWWLAPSSIIHATNHGGSRRSSRTAPRSGRLVFGERPGTLRRRCPHPSPTPGGSASPASPPGAGAGLGTPSPGALAPKPRGSGTLEPPATPPRTLILGGWQNRAFSGPLRGPKKTRFLAPCGAKSGGGGGAPPTTLILLRNQT